MTNTQYDFWLGKQAVLSGETALAIIESAISEGVSGTHDTAPANAFGRPLFRAPEHSGGLSVTMGLSASGLRSHTVLKANDLPAQYENLLDSHRRHLGYVAHVLIQNAGHRDFLTAGETGWIQLVASDTQDIVDLTIVGHKIAELTLIPVMIGIENADSIVGPVIFPDREILFRFLGQPDDFIPSPTPAQLMIFGKTRRRVPNWFSMDHPTMSGISKSGHARPLELASNREFFHSHVSEVIDQVFAEFATCVERTVAAVRRYQVEDADYVILAAGTNFGRLAAVAQHRRTRHLKAGVLSLNVLRPFPARTTCELLSGKKGLTVLEGLSNNSTTDPPLYRAVESCLDMAAQNASRKKKPVFPDLPSISERQRPTLYSGQFGAMPDHDSVRRIYDNMKTEGTRRFYCDVDWSRKNSTYPKQQILLQNIRRDYPKTEQYSLPAGNADAIPTGDTYSLILQPMTMGHELTAVVETIGNLLSRLWNMRIHFALLDGDGPGLSGIQLNFTRQPFPYPVEKSDKIDALILSEPVLQTTEALQHMEQGAIVVVRSSGEQHALLSMAVLDMMRQKSLRLHVARPIESWEDVLVGMALRVASECLKETPIPAKELERAEKVLKGEPWSWSDARSKGLSAGWTVLDSLVDPSTLPVVETLSKELPLAVRRYEDQGPPYSRVSQFYDRCGYFYQNHATDEIIPDPFHSLAVLPAATMNFSDATLRRHQLPDLVSERCTGCGRCFVYCPDVAIAPIVISVESLLKYSADTSQAAGSPMTELTPPVVKNVARAANALMTQGQRTVVLQDVLEEALTKVAPLMKIDGDRLVRLADEVRIAAGTVSGLPLIRTEAFFKTKENGHLFALAVNTQSCTGCGVCADVCPEQALMMAPATIELGLRHQAGFHLWERLPDTPASVVEEKYHDEGYEPFAAILLSRNYNMAMTGGSPGERRTSEKMVTHLVTAVAESVLQSTTNLHLKAIEKRIADLSEKIQSKLREALPTGNLDALLQSFSGQDAARLSLDTLIAKLGQTQRFGVVETAWIERLIVLINELKNLSYMLSKGPTGSGRSRFGAILSTRETLAWTQHFPFNAFNCPVMICDNPSAMDFAWGVMQGHIRQALDNVKLLRRADLEIKNEYNPVLHDTRIAGLSWSDLDDSEKSLVPPVLLVLDDRMMSAVNPSGFLRLLTSTWPIKVLVLDRAGDGPAGLQDRLTNLLTAMSLRSSFILQSSPATPRHLFGGLREGFHYAGPALFRLLTPDSPNIQHGGWPAQYELALHSRTFPTLRFKPSSEKKFVSTSLDLGSNPGSDSDWCSINIAYREAGEEKSTHYTLTYGDWAIRQTDMQKHFELWKEGSGPALGLAEYLELDPAARKDKVPVVVMIGDAGSLEKYIASEYIVRTTEAIRLGWNTLKEIAGMLTPYPLKLKESIEEDLSRKHEAAIHHLKVDYEERLREQEKAQLGMVKQKLADKLAALSGYTPKR